MLKDEKLSSETLPALKEIVRQRELSLNALTQERVALESRTSSAISWMVVLLISSLSASVYLILPNPDFPADLREPAKIAVGLAFGAFAFSLISALKKLCKFRYWHTNGSVQHSKTDSEFTIISLTAAMYEKFYNDNSETLSDMQIGFSSSIFGVFLGMAMVGAFTILALFYKTFEKLIWEIPFLNCAFN